MWYDDESPEIGLNRQSVNSAWLVVALLFFGLVAHSAVLGTLSSGPETLAGKNAPLSRDEFRVSYQDVLQESPVAVRREPLRAVTHGPIHRGETVTPIE